MPRRTRFATRKWYGEVFRIPPREGGALAHCNFCSWSRWFPDRERKKWNSFDRANQAVKKHVETVHPDKCLKISTEF
jgi:hypothetical protein